KLRLVLVEIVLRLLRHRERTGQGGLDPAIGAGAQEKYVAHLDRVRPLDRSDHARNRVGVTGAVERGAWTVQVHAFQGGGETVRVALAPDLAIGDDVDPGALHVADRYHRGIVLRLLQPLRRHAPDLLRAHARRQPAAKHLPVDQPVGL